LTAPAEPVPLEREYDMRGKTGPSLAVALVLATVANMVSSAATRRVPSAYPTIQAAIDVCVTGDTVLVAPGTYEGNGNRDLSFHGVNLVLLSESGAPNTIIDCGGELQHRGLIFQHGETRASIVDGFTIQNGYHTGGAVRVEGPAGPTILTNNRGWELGGYGYNSGGAAVSVELSGSPRVENCLITNNDGSYTGAGAIYFESVADAVVDHCTLTGNSGGGEGGAISVAHHMTGAVTVSNCLLEGNVGLHGGGIGGGAATVENCEITRNQVDGFGGGVELEEPSTISHCTISRNLAALGGGGVALGDCAINQCILWGNCSSLGPNIAASGSVVLTCCAAPDSAIKVYVGGSIRWNGAQVPGNPHFCELPACPRFLDGPAGDYHLRSDSPCLAQFSPCHDLIGYWDEGCAAPQPVGACCLLGQLCQVMTSTDCAARQGLYQGDGTPCYPKPCNPVPIRTMSWGQIKSTFR